jgi:tetratricopeptide (TPR) repeat protein
MKLRVFLLPLAAIASLALNSATWAGPAEDGNAALDAMKAGNYARAVTLLTRALAAKGLSGEDREFAYSQRGAANLKLGKSAAAAADFKAALKIKPDDADAQAGLQEAQNSSSAAAPAAHAAAGPSLRPEQAAQAGMDALSSGDYARAVQMFTRAIDSGALHGDDAELAYLSRGKAYSQRGDFRNAVADLNRAMHLKADDQEAQEAFAKALGQVKAQTPGTAMDNATCTKNFSTVGSVLSGKSYTSFAEYPTLSTLEAFAGLFSAIPAYTPSPGQNWQITAADLGAGTINANITFPESNRAITLEGHVEQDGAGAKVTLKETVPGLIITLDLKGTLCHTLADAAKG